MCLFRVSQMCPAEFAVICQQGGFPPLTSLSETAGGGWRRPLTWKRKQEKQFKRQKGGGSGGRNPCLVQLGISNPYIFPLDQTELNSLARGGKGPIGTAGKKHPAIGSVGFQLLLRLSPMPHLMAVGLHFACCRHTQVPKLKGESVTGGALSHACLQLLTWRHTWHL